VLRVLNGGAITTWVNDPAVGCIRGKDEPQADLRDLEEEARVVRETFFSMDQFKDHVAALRKELTAAANTKVQTAEAKVRASSGASARERAQRELGNARRKASRQAIERSLFSACTFELEDMVLDAIDKHFQSIGLVVSSLQFDGLHVQHNDTDLCDESTRKWVQLEAAMRGAEAAVERTLGYTIQLMEKALYDGA